MKRFAPFCVVLCALLPGCHSERADRRACDAAPAKPAEPPRKPEKYAVLVNGDTELRHKRNIAHAYTTLRALGFEPAHIFVVSPPDRRNTLPPATLHLTPAPDNFWRVMDDLAGIVAEGDLLVVYGTGHGGTDQGDSLLELRKGELWPADLREEIDEYRGNSLIVMDQCYSGGFVDAFNGTRSRAILISSVDRRHPTDCTQFARTFWDSFLQPGLADRNGDGKTSVREAFDAALKAHQEALAGDPELRSNGIFRSFNGFDDALLN
jgi:hypothetical protein